jgi:hypothetical protein
MIPRYVCMSMVVGSRQYMCLTQGSTLSYGMGSLGTGMGIGRAETERGKARAGYLYVNSRSDCLFAKMALIPYQLHPGLKEHAYICNINHQDLRLYRHPQPTRNLLHPHYLGTYPSAMGTLNCTHPICHHSLALSKANQGPHKRLDSRPSE